MTILEKINKASLRLLTTLSLKETYRIVGSEAKKLVNADYCKIYLEQDGTLKSVYSSHRILDDIQYRKRGNTIRSWKKNKAFVVDAASDVTEPHPEVDRLGVKSAIFIPIANKGKSVGVLLVQSKKVRKVNKDDFHALRLFGAMTTLAIRKAQLYDEIHNALETRDLFISMASHEIRTPLTTINGYVQLLSKRFDSTPTAEAEWIKEMSWECYRLNLLVNELLEINRIRTGKLIYNWSECDLREIVRRAITNFKFGHRNGVIDYKEHSSMGEAKVIGDFDKLLQVLTNILDNAAKFSPADAPIAILLSYRYPFYKVEITDKGTGIDRNQLKSVFEQFYKANEHQQGLGLGLFLSKKIIERHKGTIAIESKKGKGTKITIKLPKAKI